MAFVRLQRSGKFWWRNAVLLLLISLLVVVLCLHLQAGRGSDRVSALVATDVATNETSAWKSAQSGVLVLNISYLRWAWWPLILYIFWAMGYICDVYFVRAIEVIVERFEIPDDVAGATLMALGCNGPELALNTIAIFHPSDIGVGAVIGGEVFNIFVIIGAALLATPREYLPLQLGRTGFFRDVCFYAVSVALLYYVLQDGLVSRLESVLLLCGAAAYSVTVVFSPRIRRVLLRLCRRRMGRYNASPSPSSVWSGDLADEDELDEPSPVEVSNWQRARQCAYPSEGSILSVRVEMRNRMMDRRHDVDERYMWLRPGALMVSTAVDPQAKNKSDPSGGIAYDYDNHTQYHHWHHGGLVNRPYFVADLDSCDPSPHNLTQPLLRESMAPANIPSMVDVLNLQDAPWEVIPIADILYCEPPPNPEHLVFTLHVHRHDAHLGKLITLELSAQSADVLDAWVDALSDHLREERRGTAAAPAQMSLLEEWIEWLQFPVKFLCKVTIPDMDNPKLQDWYVVAFLMSMFWLAVAAFCVVMACDGIHTDFGISNTILGMTVAAAGTSFPNVFSGMVVSRQGRTGMAVANALGANIQNVFVALAIPWFIQTWFFKHGPLPLAVRGLQPAIVDCAVSFVPVLAVYLYSGYSLPQWAGYLFLLFYAIYLFVALSQESSNCATWPIPCGP